MSNDGIVEKSLVFAFLEFLTEKKQKIDTLAQKEEEKSESLEVAIQCLSDLFAIDLQNPSQKASLSLAPASLLDILQIYLKKKGSLQSTGHNQENTPRNECLTGNAEELKVKGNDALAKKNYDQAVCYYSQAIKLKGDNAVYYSNRAAAYSYLGKDDLAKVDCLEALNIDATYVKAYTRLGLAETNLGKLEAAVEAYEKALQLDPTNESIQTSLAQVQRKLTSPSASSAGGFPGGPGGLDFASILQNPQLMKMAAEMARNGGLAELMKNPNVAQMAQSMLGKDPEAVAELAKSFGGAAPTKDA